MSYTCKPFFSVVHRPVLHVIHMHTLFFSVVHRPVLRVIHMHTFFCRTQTCSTQTYSTCHTYAYLFLSYTDLFYMSYLCKPFSVVHRPVLHVIHMQTFFCRTQTCSACHTHANLFFLSYTDLFYMPYACQPFFFSLLSYTDLFYLLYVCIPFSAMRRPVVHVIPVGLLYNTGLLYM